MRIVNETAFTIGAKPSRPAPPEYALTVILKGAFDLKDGAWTIAKKQRDLAQDEPFMDEIGRSLAWASDFAPWKPCGDFFVLGHFHQPDGRAATEGFGSIQLGALRKSLMFCGPGRATQRLDGRWVYGPRAPMTSVPLRWEFSYGGLSDRRNPMGRGVDFLTDGDGHRYVALPQIEPDNRGQDAADERPSHPVNFAPLPPGFSARSRRIGTRDRHWSVFRAPLPPLDYDPRYHNAAPDDQQSSDFARGDEPLTLTNLHPVIPDLATRLPGLRPRVGFLRKSLGKITAHELTMNLDTVIVLPDEDQLVLTWRGVIPLREARQAGEIEWLQARVEPLASPSPFEALATAMLAGWRDAQPKTKPAVEAPAPPQPPDISASMGKARDLLAKINLPDGLRATIATEPDPKVVFTALTDHLEQMLATLQGKIPG